MDEVTGDIEIPADQQKQGLAGKMMTLSSPAAREWLEKRRGNVRPWAEFIATAKFRAPANPAAWGKRVMKNVEYYQSNYLFVFLGLVVYCILTNPLLLIALAACLGACYIIKIRSDEKKLMLMGKELSVAQQYGVVAVASFPLFWLASAGTAVFWVIGASFFLIMLHASLHVEGGEDETEPMLEEIV
ncbi:PREDICTED: prenylated Rab acceptor protein 1-like [Branchiostoma belcheri]|uniref:PRA1 family protein n=1 Tax=Branchiostoma belcheri TaxID=7741 RepID=A0A6P5AK95_BRABE|nr:PREDICTED: prenylated Rab acceptor protein 1-like [Branchiostoma belcheri]KAI8481919.1 Prenylated Rab acceptor protein 1 [Branchiostoma belcheri]